MAALAKIPVSMSVMEFLAWNPGDAQRWQLVDGEPQAMAPANRTHGTLQARLASLIERHFDARDSPCAVVTEPGIVPHVQASHNVRIPDLVVTCSGYDAEEATLTDPILVVEILSPSNQAQTWANVWAYATIPSVREIVVLRTVFIGADVLRRGADGAWPTEPERITEGDLVLDSIGFHTSLADLYRRTRLHGTAQP